MKDAMKHTNRQRPHRGFAVILALIAVGIATLIGLALAGTRDSTLATSDNLAKAASARAAAAGALDVAGEMLNDPAVIANAQGTLFDGLAVGATRVRAEINDLTTGLPADEMTSAVEIIVRGDASGIVQTARAVGRITRANDSLRADLDCSEFALLATDQLSIQGDAHVGLWRASPLSVLSEAVRFGAVNGSAQQVHVDSRATVHGCVELRHSAFAPRAEDADEDLADKICPIPADIHVPDAPTPASQINQDAVATLALDGLLTHDATAIGDVRVPARAAATVRDAVTLDVGGNLWLDRGCRLTVEGALLVIVRGNIVFDACDVEVSPTGSLTILAMGDITADSAYIGGLRSDMAEGRDASGGALYDHGASRISIFVSGDQRVLLTQGSVLKGQVYAPQARIDLELRSAVYGRLLGNRITLHEGVALFYDPALDMRRGWSNRLSGVWSADGVVEPSVREVAALDSAELTEFAQVSGIEPDSPSVAHGAIAVASASAVVASPLDGEASESSRSSMRRRARERSERAMARLREIFGDDGPHGRTHLVSLGFDRSNHGGDR